MFSSAQGSVATLSLDASFCSSIFSSAQSSIATLSPNTSFRSSNFSEILLPFTVSGTSIFIVAVSFWSNNSNSFLKQQK